MSQTIDSAFGRIRSFFWPIHRNETKKLVPMLLMIFLICFCYSILRCMKDTIVVTTSGAVVIPFIKVWVLLPMAILLTIVFTKLSNRLSQERVFYYMVTGFLIYFGLFAFVIYPNRDALRFHGLAMSLEKVVPVGLQGLIGMIEHWTLTLFYVISELWSSIVLTVLFWGFANEITRITEARRFYAVLSVGSNIAAIIAGQVANYFSRGGIFNPNLPIGHDAWEQTLMILVAVVIVCGSAAMGIFRWMNQNVLNDSSYNGLHAVAKNRKVKKKLSFRKSFSHLSNSKYLMYIAVIVVAYNIVINLVEVIWKDQLNQMYPDPSDYNRYMNNLTSIIGLISTIVAFFMAGMIGKFGWTKTALITPIILLITSVGFFTFYFFDEYFVGFVMTAIGTTPLAIVVFFGGVQNCLSKAAKYSVFDATKEMSFIPLDHESKLMGKAVIDGVGSRFGKSGGFLIHQGLLIIFGSLGMIAPYVAAILLVVIALWISATRSLGKEFNALIASKTESEEQSQEVTQAVTV